MCIRSFSIVLYELHLSSSVRSAALMGVRPFGEMEMTPGEVLERILRPPEGDPHRIFRPRLESLHECPEFVTECIEDCWREDLEERPDFKVLLRSYRSPIIDIICKWCTLRLDNS